MMRSPTLVLAVLFAGQVAAQPLIDLFTGNGLVSDGLERTEGSATVPLKLDTAGRLLILDPYWVQWRATTDGKLYAPDLPGDREETMQGAGGAITYVTPLGLRWKVAMVAICRYHWLGEQRHGDIQPGGVLLASRTFSPTLVLRTGVYANHDAFGLFVMPLAGIDWRIHPRHNLYGVLPGSLTYEHKLGSRFHWGASFRAYTTSFGVRDGDYRRINENPLGAYGDVYIRKNIVLRAEGGWCFVRRVLGGPGDPLFDPATADRRGYADHRIASAAYVRIVLAYRLRLDGSTR